MDTACRKKYVELLRTELIAATGCTEPIAISYAAAKARAILGTMPEAIEVKCSGNIIKNVKAVTVPNSGGQRGIETAAILGAVGGREDKELEVLNDITPQHIELTKKLKDQGICTCSLAEGVENLYIGVTMTAGSESSFVEIRTKHTNITKIEKNGELLFEGGSADASSASDRSILNLKDIYDFAETTDVNQYRDILDRQLSCNSAISEEGKKGGWGAEIGKTVVDVFGDDWRFKAIAAAAAGSDARMNGCPMPVVINSGSGNQGMTVSLPIYEYYKQSHCSEDRFYRALALANLVSLLQKKHIGNLSAYCGAACAGCASVCGIAYMDGASMEEIGQIVVNSASMIGGMVCDGAKSSCAGKIALSVFSGLLAYEQVKRGHSYKAGEGIIAEDIEQSISNIGRMGREGMKSTDLEILKIMIGK